MHTVEYKIIGGDGVEYGPALLEELKGWVREGRVAGMTPVWRSDLQRWSPAERYAELGAELARLYAATQARDRPTGFWMRFCAFVLDRAILCCVFIIVYMPVASWQHWKFPDMPEQVTDETSQHFRQQLDAWMYNKAAPIFYPMFFLYEVLLNGCYGATVGKMAIGARILTYDGSRLGYQRASLRWLAERISDFTFGFGYLLITFRPDKRALHDLLAGTKVVYRK